MILVASLTSAGFGPWGFAMLGHMAWSYVLLAAGFGFVLAMARPRPAGS